MSNVTKITSSLAGQVPELRPAEEKHVEHPREESTGVGAGGDDGGEEVNEAPPPPELTAQVSGGASDDVVVAGPGDDTKEYDQQVAFMEVVKSVQPPSNTDRLLTLMQGEMQSEKARPVTSQETAGAGGGAGSTVPEPPAVINYERIPLSADQCTNLFTAAADLPVEGRGNAHDVVMAVWKLMIKLQKQGHPFGEFLRAFPEAFRADAEAAARILPTIERRLVKLAEAEGKLAETKSSSSKLPERQQEVLKQLEKLVKELGVKDRVDAVKKASEKKGVDVSGAITAVKEVITATITRYETAWLTYYTALRRLEATLEGLTIPFAPFPAPLDYKPPVGPIEDDSVLLFAQLLWEMCNAKMGMRTCPEAKRLELLTDADKEMLRHILAATKSARGASYPEAPQTLISKMRGLEAGKLADFLAHRDSKTPADIEKYHYGVHIPRGLTDIETIMVAFFWSLARVHAGLKASKGSYLSPELKKDTIECFQSVMVILGQITRKVADGERNPLIQLLQGVAVRFQEKMVEAFSEEVKRPQMPTEVIRTRAIRAILRERSKLEGSLAESTYEQHLPGSITLREGQKELAKVAAHTGRGMYLCISDTGGGKTIGAHLYPMVARGERCVYIRPNSPELQMLACVMQDAIGIPFVSIQTEKLLVQTSEDTKTIYTTTINYNPARFTTMSKQVERIYKKAPVALKLAILDQLALNGIRTSYICDQTSYELLAQFWWDTEDNLTVFVDEPDAMADIYNTLMKYPGRKTILLSATMDGFAQRLRDGIVSALARKASERSLRFQEEKQRVLRCLEADINRYTAERNGLTNITTIARDTARLTAQINVAQNKKAMVNAASLSDFESPVAKELYETAIVRNALVHTKDIKGNDVWTITPRFNAKEWEILNSETIFRAIFEQCNGDNTMARERTYLVRLHATRQHMLDIDQRDNAVGAEAAIRAQLSAKIEHDLASETLPEAFDAMALAKTETKMGALKESDPEFDAKQEALLDWYNAEVDRIPARIAELRILPVAPIEFRVRVIDGKNKQGASIAPMSVMIIAPDGKSFYWHNLLTHVEQLLAYIEAIRRKAKVKRCYTLNCIFKLADYLDLSGPLSLSTRFSGSNAAGTPFKTLGSITQQECYDYLIAMLVHIASLPEGSPEKLRLFTRLTRFRRNMLGLNPERSLSSETVFGEHAFTVFGGNRENRTIACLDMDDSGLQTVMEEAIAKIFPEGDFHQRVTINSVLKAIEKQEEVSLRISAELERRRQELTQIDRVIHDLDAEKQIACNAAKTSGGSVTDVKAHFKAREEELITQRDGVSGHISALEKKQTALPGSTTDIFSVYARSKKGPLPRATDDIIAYEEEVLEQAKVLCPGTREHARAKGYDRPRDCDIRTPLCFNKADVEEVSRAYDTDKRATVALFAKSMSGVLRTNECTPAQYKEFITSINRQTREIFAAAGITRGANVKDITTGVLAAAFSLNEGCSAEDLDQFFGRFGRMGLNQEGSVIYIFDISCLFRYATWLMPAVFTWGRNQSNIVEALAHYSAHIDILRAELEALPVPTTQEERDDDAFTGVSTTVVPLSAGAGGSSRYMTRAERDAAEVAHRAAVAASIEHAERVVAARSYHELRSAICLLELFVDVKKQTDGTPVQFYSTSEECRCTAEAAFGSLPSGENVVYTFGNTEAETDAGFTQDELADYTVRAGCSPVVFAHFA